MMGLALLTLLCAAPFLLGAGEPGAGDLVGSPPPGWGGMAWAQGGPVPFESLHGKVVLVRWWTDTCPFCRTSAPALESLHDEFGNRGLSVIGMYHPKPPRLARPEEVRAAAKRLGISFPVAIDDRWENLRRWWLSRGGRRATSVSFLLDREGKVRYIHPGPVFALPGRGGDKAVADYHEIRSRVRALLAEAD